MNHNFDFRRRTPSLLIGIAVVLILTVFFYILTNYISEANGLLKARVDAELACVGYISHNQQTEQEIHKIIISLASNFVDAFYAFRDAKERSDEKGILEAKMRMDNIVSARNIVMDSYPHYFHKKSWGMTYWMYYENGRVSFSGPFDKKGYDLCRGILF